MDNNSELGFIIAVLNGKNADYLSDMINQYKETNEIKANAYQFADFRANFGKAYLMIHDDLLTIDDGKATSKKDKEKKGLSKVDYAKIEAQLKEDDTGKKSDPKATRKEDIIASILEHAEHYEKPENERYSVAISFKGNLSEIREFTDYIRNNVPFYADKYLQVIYDSANKKIVLLEDVAFKETEMADINLAVVAPSA